MNFFKKSIFVFVLMLFFMIVLIKMLEPVFEKQISSVFADRKLSTKLIEELKESRVMLYKGDENETFCLALGEAQAAGVPAVVQRFGSVVERVKDGLTGAVTETEEEFVKASVKLLADDEHWFTNHRNSQALQRDWGWSQAAEAFERLIPK